MADVTVERSAELTKEVALLKSRNKTLGNIVDVDKDILIKSKEQATAMGELGDNVKSIGNNILSGAENLTTSIFGGSLGGVLNSLTIGMVKRKNENAKIEKEKARDVAKATAEEQAINDKRMSVLVETLALSEEVAEDGRKFADLKNEEILEIIKNTELEKEKRERNEKIKEEEQKAFDFIKKENKAKENGGATVSSESDTSGEFTVISDFLKAGMGNQSDNLEKIVASTEKTSVATTKSQKNEETPEDRREKLRNAREAKGIGGQVVKLEGAEDTGGFSLMDIFKKGGRTKLLASLATGLTGIGSFAFSKEGGLFSAMKGVQVGKTAGFALLAGGIVAIATDALKGIISLNNPNYKGSNRSLNASLESTITDRLTNYGYKSNKTGFSVASDFEYYDDLYWKTGISSYVEKLETNSTASANIKKQEGSYFDTLINQTFRYDKRNQKFKTTSGFISRFTQNIPLISESYTLTNAYDYKIYNEWFDENIFSFGFYAKASNSLTGKNIRLSDRLHLPASKLRGFEAGKIGPKDGTDFVGGNYITSINASTTLPQILPNLQNTNFSLFFDAANIWGVDYSSSLDDESKLRSSIGIAVDFFTPIGPLNFSLSEPITKGKNDITESFRFNLGTTF